MKYVAETPHNSLWGVRHQGPPLRGGVRNEDVPRLTGPKHLVAERPEGVHMTVFIANDGSVFLSFEECAEYNKSIRD